MDADYKSGQDTGYERMIIKKRKVSEKEKESEYCIFIKKSLWYCNPCKYGDADVG
jgi:hypothetical protein